MAEPLATAFVQLTVKTGSLYDAIAADFDRIERRARATGQQVGQSLHQGITQGVGQGGSGGIGGVFQTLMHPIRSIFHQQGQQAGQSFNQGFRQSVHTGMAGGGGGMFGGIGTMLMGNLTTAAVAAAGTALGSVFWKGFTRSADIEDAKATMSAMGYDAATVENTMGKTGEIMKVVTGTAYSFSDAVTIATQALAAQVKPGQEVASFIQMAADAAGFAHKPLDQVGQILTKIQAQTKLYGDEMRQLGDLGLPVRSWVAEAMNMSPEELADYMQKGGTVAANVFFKALQEHTHGQAQAAGKTVRGALGNLITGVGRLGATLMEPFWGDLPSLFSRMTKGLDAFGAKAKPVVENVAKWFSGTLLPAARTVANHFLTTWRDVWPKIQEKAGPLMETLRQTWTRLQPIVKALGGLIVWVTDKVIQSIPYFMEFATQFLTGFNKVYDWVKNSFWPTMVKVWEAISGAVGTAWDFIRDKFNAIAEGYDKLLKFFEDSKQRGLNALDWLMGPWINFDQNGVLQTSAGGVAMQGMSSPMMPGAAIPGVSTAGLQPQSMAALQAIFGRFGGSGISLTSGYRATDPYEWHPGGRGLDIGIPNWQTPQGVALGNQINAWIQANKEMLGVYGTLWQVADHYNHIHVSMKKGLSPLLAGMGAQPGMPPVYQTSAGPIASMGYGVPLAPQFGAVPGGGSGGGIGLPGVSGSVGINASVNGSVAGTTDSGWIWGVPRNSPAGKILGWVSDNWRALQTWGLVVPDALTPDSGAGRNADNQRQHQGQKPPGAPDMPPLTPLPDFGSNMPSTASGGDAAPLLTPGGLGNSALLGLTPGGSSKLQLTGQKGLAQMLFGDSFMSLFDIIGNMFRESLGVPMMFSDPSQWGVFKAVSGILGFGSSLIPGPEQFLQLAGVTPEMIAASGMGGPMGLAADPAKAAKAAAKVEELKRHRKVLEQRLAEQQAKGDKVAKSTLMSTQEQLDKNQAEIDKYQQQADMYSGQGAPAGSGWGAAGGGPVGMGPLTIQDALNMATGLGFLKQGLAFGSNIAGGNYSGAASSLMQMPFGIGPTQIGSPGFAPGSAYTAYQPAGSSGTLPVGAVPNIPLGQFAPQGNGAAPVGGGNVNVNVDNSVNVGQGGVVGSVTDAIDQAARPAAAAARTNWIPIRPGVG